MPLPLKIVLSILGTLLLLFILLLIIPIKIRVVSKDQSTALTISFLFFKFRIIPKKKKKFRPSKYTKKKLEKLRKKDAERAKKKALKAEKKRLKKQKDGPELQEEVKKRKKTKEEKALMRKKIGAVVDNIPEALSTLIYILESLFSTFFSHLRIKMAMLHIYVGGQDPAATSYTYVGICSAMNATLTFLQKKSHINKLHNYDVIIKADYLREKTEFEADISVGMNLFGLFCILIRLVIDLISAAVRFRSLIEVLMEKLPEQTKVSKSTKGNGKAERSGNDKPDPEKTKSEI